MVTATLRMGTTRRQRTKRDPVTKTPCSTSRVGTLCLLLKTRVSKTNVHLILNDQLTGHIWLADQLNDELRSDVRKRVPCHTNPNSATPFVLVSNASSNRGGCTQSTVPNIRKTCLPNVFLVSGQRRLVSDRIRKLRLCVVMASCCSRFRLIR